MAVVCVCIYVADLATCCVICSLTTHLRFFFFSRVSFIYLSLRLLHSHRYFHRFSESCMHLWIPPISLQAFCGYVGQFCFDVIPSSWILSPPTPQPRFNHTHMWLQIKRNTGGFTLLILPRFAVYKGSLSLLLQWAENINSVFSSSSVATPPPQKSQHNLLTADVTI